MARQRVELSGLRVGPIALLPEIEEPKLASPVLSIKWSFGVGGNVTEG